MTAGTSSYVDLTAGRFHYRQWPADADAPSVVLLHGNGDTSTTWSRVAPALSAAGWAVFAPDLRGNGSSVRPPVGCYGLAEVAADVQDLIDALRLRDPAVVGHCWGAAVALTLATGGSVPSGLGRVVLEELPSDLSGAADLAVVQDYLRMMRSPREYVRNWVDLICRNWHPVDRESLLENVCGADIDVYLSTIKDGAGPLLPLLARLELPALVLRGNPRRGSILSDADWRELRRYLPDHGVARELAGSGHEVHRGDYTTYMSLVEDFLRSS